MSRQRHRDSTARHARNSSHRSSRELRAADRQLSVVSFPHRACGCTSHDQAAVRGHPDAHARAGSSRRAPDRWYGSGVGQHWRDSTGLCQRMGALRYPHRLRAHDSMEEPPPSTSSSGFMPRHTASRESNHNRDVQHDSPEARDYAHRARGCGAFVDTDQASAMTARSANLTGGIIVD